MRLERELEGGAQPVFLELKEREEYANLAELSASPDKRQQNTKARAVSVREREHCNAVHRALANLGEVFGAQSIEDLPLRQVV